MKVDRLGTVLVLASGLAFGANAIFAKLSYHAGATVGTFLTVRFCLAALVFWLVFRPRVTRAEARPGLLLGLAYCGQAGFFFTAVSLQDAGVTSIFQAATPVLVGVAAVLIGREAARARTFLAIAVASVGMGLVALGGGSVGHVVPLGLVLALAAAIWYSAYLLVGDHVMARLAPLPLSTLIATGGAIGFSCGSAALGQLRFDFAPIGWLWLAASALVSTVLAIMLVMAGMRRIGPSLTGLLTAFEPVATVTYAAFAFGERLTPLQLVGGALIILSVVAVQLPSRRPATVRV